MLLLLNHNILSCLHHCTIKPLLFGPNLIVVITEAIIEELIEAMLADIVEITKVTTFKVTIKAFMEILKAPMVLFVKYVDKAVMIDYFDRMNLDIFGKVPSAKLAAMYAHFSSKSSPS